MSTAAHPEKSTRPSKRAATNVPGDDRLAADPADEPTEDDAEESIDSSRRFLFFQAMPAWLVSTLVHALILLILGLVSFADPIQIVNVLTASSTGEEGPEIEELSIEDFDPRTM